MYIDETGGADGEIKVTVEGEEYTAEETYSYHHDGVNDSAIVDTGDGGHLVFTDSHHTGHADLLTTLDSHGNVVSQATYDEHSGEWVASGTTETGDHQTGGDHRSETIVVDTKDGHKDVGPPTEDTDGDGVPDTAVVRDADGNTWLYTDTHHSGHADLATEITPTGQVIMSERTGDNDWTEVERGHLDRNGQFVPDSQNGASQPVRADHDSFWDSAAQPGGGQQEPSGVLRIDAATGQWVSGN